MMKKLTLIIYVVLLSAICVGLHAQSYEYSFGSGSSLFYASKTTTSSWYTTSSSTLPTPASGTMTIGVGEACEGYMVQQNPGLSALGSQSEFRFNASDHSSYNNFFNIHGWTGASSLFYGSIDVLLGDSTGGTNTTDGYFYLVAGYYMNYWEDMIPYHSYITAGLRFQINSSGIDIKYPTSTTGGWWGGGSTWSDNGLTVSSLNKGQKYTIEFVVNNSYSTKYYSMSGTSCSVGSGKYDIWINGSLIGNELNRDRNSTTINSFALWGGSSSSDAHAFVDNIVYSSGIPATIDPTATNWTGNYNYNWSDYRNWSNGVPTSSSDVIIQYGNYTPEISSDANVKSVDINPQACLKIETEASLTVSNNLTLESDSSGTASLFNEGLLNCDTSDIYFERYFSANRVHYFSSPVKYGETSALSTSSMLYAYNESEATVGGVDYGWSIVSTGGGTLNSGQGYATYYTSNTTATFSGSLVENDHQMVISNTYSGVAYADGWNLVGNPFPCGISADSFVQANPDISGALYFWDERSTNYKRYVDYGIWTMTGAIGAGTPAARGDAPTGVISPGQGFFVRLDSTKTTSQLNMNLSMRVCEACNQFFVTEPKPVQRIRLLASSPDNYYTENLLGFLEDATMGKDRLYDAVKLSGNNSINFYSLIDGEHYAIQGMPYLNEEERIIPMGLVAGNPGSYEISIKELENIPDDLQILLLDINGQDTTLWNLKDEAYTIDLLAGEYNNRFFIQLIPTIVQISVEENDHAVDEVHCYASDKNIFIRNSRAGKDISVYIYSLSGKLIKSLESSDELITIDMQDYASGMYLVKTQNQSSKQLAKLMIE
jgi:hypothetical protein